MNSFKSVGDVVALWPDRRSFCIEVQEENPLLQVTLARCNKWAQGSPIPAKFHHAILLAAKRRGFSISAEDLAVLHNPRAA